MVQAEPHLSRSLAISTKELFVKNPILLGRPLADHSIFCNETCATANAVAQKLHGWILQRFGVNLSITSTAESGAAYILIEPLSHAPYGEGRLSEKGGCVCIQGNDIVGLTEAAAMLVSLLSRTDAVDTQTLCYHATLPERASYAANADAFAPCYRHAYICPTKERTLAQKRDVLQNPAGRPFVIAHRGEHVFYPENSLEGAISAWHGGADAVEVDIQKSADGVWVCMHDENVTRTTNAADLLGKQGYPTSPMLRDWTLAQLRTLCLKDAYGVQTPFPIPTLEEILLACDGRIFVHLDKAFSVTEEIFPYMEELGVFDCIYLVNHVSIADILQHKDHFAKRGVRLENLCRPRREMTLEKTLPLMLENLPHITPALIPIGDYVKHGERERAMIAHYRDRIRFGAWFLRDFDTPSLWKEAYAQGVSIFMTDLPLDLMLLLSQGV